MRVAAATGQVGTPPALLPGSGPRTARARSLPMYSQFRKLVLSTALSISTVTLCGSSAAAAPLVIDRFLGNQSALSMTYPAPMPSIS